MSGLTEQPLSLRLGGKALAIPEAVRIATALAEVLGTLHQRGQIYGDLKPANILVAQNSQVRLADLGLSQVYQNLGQSLRSPTPSGQQNRNNVDSARILVGTLPYMSPEQVKGEALDIRSDIFSFGTVFYEMLTGQRPFAGASSQELTHTILRAQPKPPHELVPAVPSHLEALLLRMMARDRDARPQNTDDILAELRPLDFTTTSLNELSSEASVAEKALRLQTKNTSRWLLVFFGIAVVAATALWRVSKKNADAIIIAPMEVRGQKTEADYVGRAFAEAIAVNLAQSSQFKVLPVPMSSELDAAGAFGRAAKAQKLGAGKLLTGAVTRDADRLIASVSLLDTEQNRLVWGTEISGPDQDLSPLAANLARRVAVALGENLPIRYDYVGNLSGTGDLANVPQITLALAALRNSDRESLTNTARALVQQFPRALEANVLLAHAYLLTWDAEPSMEHRNTLEGILKTIDSIDPNNPYTQFYRANILWSEGRSQDAVDAYDKLLTRQDLSPMAQAWVLRYRAAARTGERKVELAMSDLERALALDPANAFTISIMSERLREIGRLDDALLRAQQAVALLPSHWRSQQILGTIYSDLQKFNEARDAYENACRRSRSQHPCSLYAITLRRLGSDAPADAAARQAETYADSLWGTYNLACYWALAGHREQSVKYLQKSVTLGLADGTVENDPDLSAIRSDPAYLALVQEVKKRAASRQQ